MSLHSIIKLDQMTVLSIYTAITSLSSQNAFAAYAITCFLTLIIASDLKENQYKISLYHSANSGKARSVKGWIASENVILNTLYT